MKLDTVVLSAAFFGFLIFLISHVIVLKGFKPERIPFVLLGCVALGGASNLGSYLLLIGSGRLSFLGVFVSLLMFSLLIFHYFNWVFGMGEAAIRIRLLCELHRRNPPSATLNEIEQDYNDAAILKLRLDRLVSAGHLKWGGQFYRIGNRILFIQISIQKMFKSLFGVS